MTLRLMLADRALRKLPILVLFAAWLGQLWPVAWRVSGGLDVVDTAAVWVLLGSFFIAAHSHTRTSSFEMALPIPARQLWCARVLTLAGSSVILIGAVVTSACLRSPEDGEILQAGAHFAGTASLAVAVLFAAYPKRSALPLNWRLLWFGVAGIAGAVLLTRAMLALPAMYAVAPLATAAAIGWWAYRSLPANLELAPRKPETPRRAHQTAAVERPPRIAGRWSVVGGTLRAVVALEWWIVLAMLLIFGALPGSGQYTVLVIIVLPVLFLPVLQSTVQLAHLPVSRRLIFACGTLPGVAAWMVGSAAGQIIWSSLDNLSLLMTVQPGGPETLNWVHLGPSAALFGVFAASCVLLWLAGLLVQMKYGCAAVGSGWGIRVRQAVELAFYGAITLTYLFLTVSLDDASFVPWLRRGFTYNLLVAVHRTVEWLPANPHLIATLTVILGAAAYRVAERRFLESELPSKKKVEEVC